MKNGSSSGGGGGSPSGTRRLHAAGAARPLDALIAGAQKSGTSTLAAALERLPGVVTHHDYMEFPFFIDETRFPGGYGEAFQRYFGNDLPEGLVLAKSAGVMFLESAVHQVAEHNPNLKVIVILREPVARAYSAYNFLRRQGREDAGTFEEGLAREADRLAEGRHLFAYRGRGDYLPQVRRLHEVLGADRVRVCLLEDLQEHEEELTRSLADWLGLEAPPELAPVQRVNESAGSRSRLLSALLHDPDSPLARMRRAVPGRVRRRIVTGLESLNQRPPDRVPMQQATRDELHEWFAPRNDALAGYIERDLTHWNRPSE